MSVLEKVQNKIIKVLWAVFFIILYSLIAFCRLYLGMHASNQILTGASIGLYMVLAYRFYFESKINLCIEKMFRVSIIDKKRYIECQICL